MSILSNVDSGVISVPTSEQQFANLNPNSLQNESELINLYNIVKGGRDIKKDPNVEVAPWEYEDDRV